MRVSAARAGIQHVGNPAMASEPLRKKSRRVVDITVLLRTNCGGEPEA
jgi:hypothetical protein